MYSFKKHEFDWLLIHESRPMPGDTHLKAFVRDTHPHDQITLNIYVSGEFVIGIGDFSQTMTPGSSSIDLALDVVPSGVVVLERAASDGCMRMCIQSKDPATRWSRKRVEVLSGQTVSASDGFIIPMKPIVQAHRVYTAEGDESVFVLERI